MTGPEQVQPPDPRISALAEGADERRQQPATTDLWNGTTGLGAVRAELASRVQVDAPKITGQTAEWCRNWATFLDRQADEYAEEGRMLLDRAVHGHVEAQEYRDYAELACHHCGKTPERDGDHTCPCPHRDDECPDHLLTAPAQPDLDPKLSPPARVQSPTDGAT